MPEKETTVTTKGQVTIPAEIRAKLGLKPKDKVQFEVIDDSVVLKKAKSRIERHFGVVPVPGVLDSKQEREAFEEGVAEEVAAKG